MNGQAGPMRREQQSLLGQHYCWRLSAVITVSATAQCAAPPEREVEEEEDERERAPQGQEAQQQEAPRVQTHYYIIEASKL